MKAQNARGTRDFSPLEVQRRTYIIHTIKKYFERYGFVPLETPAIENLSTLTGKYGEEGDQLLFKILNSRLHESKNKEQLKAEFERMLEKPYNSELITERALRYDLTVPLARYVSQNRHHIVFPFKRYQIQPVWRADKPQKGRYREFTQCDADIVGTDSLLMEVELIMLINDVFTELIPQKGTNENLPSIELHINHRRILQGLAEWCGVADKFYEFVAVLDQLDKTPVDEVKQLLINHLNILSRKINDLFEMLNDYDNQRRKKIELEIHPNIANIETWKNLADNLLHLANSYSLKKGIEEMNKVLELIDLNALEILLKPNIKLARGLNYYTGVIFEAKTMVSESLSPLMTSSILGGGRYDNLTGIFDLPGISGVGISFGIDRLYDIMDALSLFYEKKLEENTSADILLVYLDEESQRTSLNMAQHLRKNGIRVEVYHQLDKLKKMMEYAHKKNFPYVGIIGEQERKEHTISLKDMKTGKQESTNIHELTTKLSKI